MKKFYSVIAILAGAVSLWAASDRIDFMAADNTFFSMLTDNIKEIKYQGDETTGFSNIIVVDRLNKEKSIAISEYPTIRFCASNTSNVYAILPYQGENTQLILWNSNNNGVIDPNLPDDWKGSEVDRMNNIDWYAAPGYKADVEIKGVYTGVVYSSMMGFIFTSYAEANLLGITTQAYYMPNEPITITCTATELTTYAGSDIVGVYNGININRMGSVISSNTVTLDLDANASYRFTTTDDSNLSLHDNYIYDSAAGTFEYQAQEREYYQSAEKIGLFGWKMAPDFYIVQVRNLTTNKYEDTYNVAVSKKDAKIVALRHGTNLNYYAISYTPTGGQTSYYLLKENGYFRSAATATFISGTSFEGDCSAILAVDGIPQVKVVRQNNTVDFYECGEERGTYNNTSGLGDLILDGFGNATFGGNKYTYTIEGNLVTMTINGTERKFLIDMETKTYSEVTAANNDWNGYTEYLLTNATGYYRGVASDNNVIQILFDRNLLGKEMKGYASVRIWFGTTDMSSYAGIADVKEYTYDAANKKVTIAGVIVGDGNASESGDSYGFVNMVLNVSADKGTLTFDSSLSKIYSFNLPVTWVNTNTPIPAVKE